MYTLQEEDFEETSIMEEEEAAVEFFAVGSKGRFYSSLERLLRGRRTLCQRIVVSDIPRKIYTPDAVCPNTLLCPTCDDICARSQQGGLRWKCEAGFNQISRSRLPCAGTLGKKTFCCCAEATDYHF